MGGEVAHMWKTIRLAGAMAVIGSAVIACSPKTDEERAAELLNDPAALAEIGQRARQEYNAQQKLRAAAYEKLKAGRFSYSDDPATGVYGCRTVFKPDGAVVHYTMGGQEFDPQHDPAMDRECRGLPAIADKIASPEPSRPSFDCAKAATNVERMICNDASLGEKDARVSTLYRTWIQRVKSGAMIDPLDEIVADQKAWVQRRNACNNVECIARAYDERLDELPTL